MSLVIKQLFLVLYHLEGKRRRRGDTSLGGYLNTPVTAGGGLDVAKWQWQMEKSG